LTAQTQILICIQPADFRCQIDGLAALCRNKLNAQPNSGTLFAFINRPPALIKYNPISLLI
ncbi:MAG: IS66 family insertion sequence element accessory protein TnpB, partial [Gammaproteobacteria bacterium]